jgi:hypothetical protein
MSDLPFNPYSKKAPTYWPSVKYQADGSTRLFADEAEFEHEGEGWYDHPSLAEEAANGEPKKLTKAEEKAAKAAAKAAEAAAKSTTFDREAAIAKLVEAGYEVAEETTDDELIEALKKLGS